MRTNTMNDRRRQHRDEVNRLLHGLRRRGVAGYLGGYCENSACDVRDVLVLVKQHEEPSMREFRCPSCRSMLKLGSPIFQVTAETMDEYSARRSQS